MRRPLLTLTALSALTMTLVACGRDDPDAAAPSTTEPDATVPAEAGPVTTGPAATEPPATEPPATEPDTTVADRPERIVSLSASLTEMLFAIGAGDQVIAVDKYSNHPPGAPVTDLSGFRPNIEAIAELDPDLVVVSSDRDGIVAALDTVGIATTLLESATNVEDTYIELATLGEATGHAPEAAEVVAELRDELAATAARTPEREAPLRYYIELSDDGHSATSQTFIGSILTMAGLASIADGVDEAAGGYPQLSAEYVLEQDPDVIFVAHSDGINPTPAELSARPGWSELAAVDDDLVVELDPDVASRWGPRIADLLAAAVDATASAR